jgi:hypothetical protein
MVITEVKNYTISANEFDSLEAFIKKTMVKAKEIENELEGIYTTLKVWREVSAHEKALLKTLDK